MADAETAGNAGNHHQTEHNQGNFAGKYSLRVYKQVIATCDCSSKGKKNNYRQEGVQYKEKPQNYFTLRNGEAENCFS